MAYNGLREKVNDLVWAFETRGKNLKKFNLLIRLVAVIGLH